MDKNIVIAEGLIGEDFMYGKTHEGKPYATFSLCINNMINEYSDATERTHSQTFIRIFVNMKKQIDYLQKVNAHRGMRVHIFGRLSSYRNEYKGITYISNNVVCRDIVIIQTKSNQNQNKE